MLVLSLADMFVLALAGMLVLVLTSRYVDIGSGRYVDIVKEPYRSALNPLDRVCLNSHIIQVHIIVIHKTEKQL